MRTAWALAAMLLLLPAALPAPAGASDGTAVNIIGPERLEAATEGSYNVKIFGPAGVQWGFWVNISGAQRADAKLSSPDGSPDSSRPYIMSQNAPLAYPELNFTLTAPPKAGPLTITVTALAMEGALAAGQTATARWSVEVKARREVQLNTTVRNSGDVPVSDLKVAFMVRLQGLWTYISNETVPSLEPGMSANVSARWNSTLVENGEYTVRIVVDPAREKAQYSGSGGVVEKRIVLRDVGSKEGQSWEQRYQRLIGFIAVIAVAAAVGIWWYRRKKIV